MTAKEYLEQVKRKDAQINNLIREKQDLWLKMCSVSGTQYDSDRVQSSINPDKLGMLYSRLEDKEEQIASRIDELCDFRIEVTNLINGLSKSEYIVILYSRYVLFKPWGEIAADLSYSIRQVQRLNGKGLAEFYDLYHEQLHLNKDVAQCHI